MPMPVYSSATCVVDAVQQCTITFRDLNNQFSSSTDMRFEPGYMRIAGVHATDPGVNTDVLASYQQCPAGTVVPTIRQAALPPSIGQCVKPPCLDDCNMNLLRACAAGQYAVLSASGGVAECKPCPPNTVQTPNANMMTSCVCMSGFGREAELKAALSMQASCSSTTPGVECYSCATDVYLLNAPGQFRQTAIRCGRFSTGSQTIDVRVPVNGEIVVANDIRTCDAGSYPKAGRTGCNSCDIGFKCPANTAVMIACNPSKEYSSGQGSIACTQKKTMNLCAANQMFVPTPTSATQDNRCDDCPTVSCPVGAQTVFATGHSASNPCTANFDGTARNYFACWPSTKGQSAEYAFTDRAGYRLRYSISSNGMGSEIHLEQCLDSLLPAYAEWVQQPSSVPDGSGRQCYFACSFGVSTEVAATYNTNVAAALTDVMFKRIFFDPLITTTSSQGFENTIMHRQLVWATPDVADSQAALQNSGWTVPIQANAQKIAGTWQRNTFLLVDSVLPSLPMCLSPAQANGAGMCPLGFNRTSIQEKCALKARTSLYSTPPLWGMGVSGYAVLPSGDCWTTTTTSLSSFTPGCRDCMLVLQVI